MFDFQTLSKLSDVAQQLNAESDDFNTSIEALNDQLQALNIGLEYWLDDYPIKDSGRRRNGNFDDQDHQYQEVTTLGYCKLEDKWQLAIKEEIIGYELDEDQEERAVIERSFCKPLLKAPRDVRLEAVGLFDTLLEGLNAEAESKLRALRRAKQLAKPK